MTQRPNPPTSAPLVDKDGSPLRVVSVFRADPAQVGDLASAPKNYASELGLPWLSQSEVVDIGGDDFAQRAGDLSRAVVIVGGGGLGFDDFQENLEHVIDQCPRVLVWWGAGRNTHFGTGIYHAVADSFDNLPETAFAWPRKLDRQHFDLIGVRDSEARDRPPPGYQWVPCVSSMHPAFSPHVEKRDPVRIYTHKDPLYAFGKDVPTLTNATNTCFHVPARDSGLQQAPACVHAAETAGNAINFVRGARTVVTSSYHGAYWAQLAGTPVAVFSEFSTKMRQLPLQVLFVSLDDVRRRLLWVVERANELAESQSDRSVDLLQDARRRNLDFAAQLYQLFVDKGIHAH